MSQMRDDEIFTKNRFNEFISKRTDIPILWRDGNQNEPPDFYLTMGNVEFVVEVTRLINEVETPRGPISRYKIDSSATNFVRKIEKKAIKDGVLTGTYFIHFGFVQIDFYGHRKEIKRKIHKIIADTQFDSQSFTDIELEIETQNGNKEKIVFCSIQKTSLSDTKVEVGGGPQEVEWSVDIQDKACELLKNTVLEKKSKLERFKQPKILLLLSSYGLTNPENYKLCLSKLPNITDFHTIFIASAFTWSHDYLLCSQNPHWT